MNTGKKNIVRQLREILRCPIDFESIFGTGIDDRYFQDQWVEELRRHSIDGLEAVVAQDFEMFGKPMVGDLDRILDNAKVSVPEATAAFKDAYGWLEDVSFKSLRDHGKHIGGTKPSKNPTKKQSPSYFFNDVDETIFRDVFMDWIIDGTETGDYETSMNPSIATLLGQHNFRIALNCFNPIGVAQGEETQFLVIDYNKGNREGHCYPCREDEALKISGCKAVSELPTNDRLQGCFKPD